MPPNTNLSTTNATLNDFIGKFDTAILNPIITLLALAAFVLFTWGVVEYIRGSENDEKRKIGQQHMLWGIVGLTIMFGATVIVKVLGNVANSFFK